ncbi:MAG: hypothetical protein OS130_08030 [Thermodesulfobacteriota bacterium]|jgi:hypothetical protein|nr:MAG: hypothetical protein OS130_08030 [Thermodesulfobacteriota bacterium]
MQIKTRKRKQSKKVAGGIILTLGIPIAFYQEYFKYNPYLLPIIGFVAILFYLWAFITWDKFYKWEWYFYSRSKMISLVIFIVIGSCVGAMLGAAEWFAIHKSKEHVLSLKPEKSPPKQLTPEEIKEIAKKAAKDEVLNISKIQQNELTKEFPEGFVTFGIIKSGEPLIPGFVPEGVTVNWNTGGTRSVTQTMVLIELPDMTIKRGGGTINFIHNSATLPRKTGYIERGFGMEDLLLQIKVLNATEPVIIALGFVKEKQKER